MKPTKIHGARIVAALIADLQHKGVLKDCTRVWCDDDSLHLVTGYEAKGPTQEPCFDTVIGYWEIPEGETYLSATCKEVITRPFSI